MQTVLARAQFDCLQSIEQIAYAFIRRFVESIGNALFVQIRFNRTESYLRFGDFLFTDLVCVQTVNPSVNEFFVFVLRSVVECEVRIKFVSRLFYGKRAVFKRNVVITFYGFVYVSAGYNVTAVSDNVFDVSVKVVRVGTYNKNFTVLVDFQRRTAVAFRI